MESVPVVVLPAKLEGIGSASTRLLVNFSAKVRDSESGISGRSTSFSTSGTVTSASVLSSLINQDGRGKDDIWLIL